MQKIISRFCWIIVVAIMALSPFAHAQINDLAVIEENKKLAESNGNDAAVATYAQVINQLKLAELASADTEKYSTSIEKFIEKVAELGEIYKEAPKSTLSAPNSFEGFDLLFGQIDAELLRLQKRQLDLDDIIGTVMADRSAQISENIEALSKEESTVPAAAVSTGNVIQDTAAQQLRLATLARIAAQLEALEMERLSSKNRLELSRKELRLVVEKITRLEALRKSYQLMRDKFSENQWLLLRNALTKFRVDAGDNTELVALATDSLDLLAQWQATETEWQDVLTRREALEKSLLALSADGKRFENELGVSSVSAMLGFPLLERYETLLRGVNVNDDVIKNAHLQRLQLNSLTMAAHHDDNADDLALAGLNARQQQLYKQLQERYELVYDATSQSYDALIVELVKYKTLRNDLTLRTEDLRKLLRKNSLWEANVESIGLPWFKQIATSSVLFVQGFNTQVPDDFLASFNTFHPAHFYLLLAIVAVLYRARVRARFTASLHHWAAVVGTIKTDRINVTIYALLATLAMAMLWVSPLFLLGQYLRASDSGAGHLAAFGAMLISVARFLLVIRFLIFSSLADGFFPAHLRFPETLIGSLLNALRSAQWIGGVLVALCILAYSWPEPAIAAGVGRLLFFFLALFITGWIWFLVGEIQRISIYLGMHTHWIQLMRVVLSMLPLFAALAVLLGYYFLAQLVLVNAYQTLSILLVVLLVFMVFRRVFAIQERRLAFDRAIARRDEERAKRKKNVEESSSDSPIEIEDFEVDTAVLRSRAMSLLQLIAFLVFVAVVFRVWSEFLLAFDWLDNIALWETVKTVGSTQTVDIVSLSNVLMMAVIFLVTALLAKNLPSVIDLLLLQNLRLEPGVGFAITTVTSYVVVAVGVVAAFGTIGLDWSKMQWLVAALGVGVGFGLQEIVANLVSGLIILFERPVRVGDLITVQGESGTVSRIRMRATTIIDFDRREIVVPNKILLSEKITNWSLTDGITRVVLNVGVAYGTDPELVDRLLLQAAQESPSVLADPLPEVFFNAFGNSTLDFELRVFAEEIGRRMPVRDDLHYRILALFKANGVTIAFPQMDVHIVSDERRDKGLDGSLPPPDVV